MSEALEIEEGGEEGSAPSRKSKKKSKLSKHTPMEILSGIAAVLCVLSSVGGIVIAVILRPGGLGNPTVVLISGVLTSLVGPYSYYQQTKLTDIVALKETHQAVKREVDRLEGENVRLNETVGGLSNTMDKLEDVEGALDVITQTQGQSVSTFKEQVKENREILNQLHKQLRANVLQNLLQVVIRSDQDDNMEIEEHEIDPLINRIIKINGVEVRKDAFRERIMSSGGSLSAVMDIIKNLMAGSAGNQDDIFIIKS